MRRIFAMLLVLFFLTALQSCKGKKQAAEVVSKVNGVMDAYKHPTTKDGLYLEAKIDGEKWVADWMFIDPDPSGSINVNAHKGDEGVISFYIGKTDIKEKRSSNFSENDQVQMVDDKGNILLGSEGGYQITNVTDNWIEGNFHFTAKDQKSGATHQVTDGSFRESIPESFKAKLNM
jgi:hypothetical protein